MANKSDKITTPAEQILKDHYLLKTVEVLRVLNISRATLDKLKESASFPKAITKIGNRPMWRKEDIIKWLSN